MEIKTVKMGINGEGIGYINKKPVFIEGALPEELVEVEILEETNSFCRAKAISIIEPSPDRIRSECRYQNDCGGCPLMTMRYKSQLEYKKTLLEEALYKYGGVKRDLVREARSSEYVTGYRSSLKLPCQNSNMRLATGMYFKGTNHFQPIHECLVHHPDLEDARKQVIEALNKARMQAYDAKSMRGLRYIVMRIGDDGIQCTLVTGKGRIPSMAVKQIMRIKGIRSLFHSVNTTRGGVELFGTMPKKIAGEDVIHVELGEISLALSPDAFFQMNIEQARELYKMAVSKVDPCNAVVEAYCGAGAMSLMASPKANHVYGIESVQSAVDNANANAASDNIKNVTFMCDDAADGLYKAARLDGVDCLIVDPPRSGMDDKMLEAILHILPKKIIYVSCNPATLGKNIAVLKKEYKIVSVIPFDMFPNTPLIESITVMERG